jgi:hypothetical protein
MRAGVFFVHALVMGGAAGEGAYAAGPHRNQFPVAAQLIRALADRGCSLIGVHVLESQVIAFLDDIGADHAAGAARQQGKEE